MYVFGLKEELLVIDTIDFVDRTETLQELWLLTRWSPRYASVGAL